MIQRVSTINRKNGCSQLPEGDYQKNHDTGN